MTEDKDFVQDLRSANKFNWQSAVDQEALFINRQKELENAVVACRQSLAGTPGGGVLVVGGRGIGKTSFLIALRRMLGVKGIVSCQRKLDPSMVAEGSELTLFKHIIHDLSLAATDAGLINQSLGKRLISALVTKAGLDSLTVEFPYLTIVASKDKQAELGQFPADVLREGLKELLSKMSKPKVGLALCIDEGDFLADNVTLLHVIRNVFQEFRGIVLVLAGTSKLLDGVGQVFSAFPRFFTKIELGPYTDFETTKAAIDAPLAMIATEIETLDYTAKFHLDGFYAKIDEITDRLPLDVNLLCNLAYDSAARKARMEGNVLMMKIILDKEIMRSAIDQLRGTKSYQPFFADLNGAESSVLKILSQVFFDASVDELTQLITLDELGSRLQSMGIIDLVKVFGMAEPNKPTLFKTIESINAKAEKYQIQAFRKVFGTPTGFSLEDQWIRAYFKYTAPRVYVDLELYSRIPYRGIYVFGDPVTTILHSIFFPRLGRAITGKAEFRAHTGHGNGKAISFQKDRQLLLANYVRTADGERYHLGFLVRKEEDLGQWLGEIPLVLDELRKVGLVRDTKVELVGNAAPPQYRRFPSRR